MARKTKIIENLEITHITTEGRGIGRIDGIVCFVEKSVPGDIVNVRITKKKKDFAEGVAFQYLSLSPLRVEPFCKYFGICGGCKWQYLSYDQQLLYKDQIVKDNLQRLGKVTQAVYLPITGAENSRYYRNKMEFSFSSERWLLRDEIASTDLPLHRQGLGLHVPGNFVKVVDIDECFLQPPPSDTIRNLVRLWALEKGLSFYNRLTHQGWLRNLVIRNNRMGEVMIILIVNEENRPHIDEIFFLLKKKCKEIISYNYVVNSKMNDSIYDLPVINSSGPDHLIEKLGGLSFKISPKSFFQTNGLQAEKLYALALEMADLSGEEIVYDLYTGTGSIALFVSRYCAKVIGVETVPDAIADAHINATLNDLHNALFFTGDVKDVFTPAFAATHGHPDLIITDPPRAGMHPEVIDTMLMLAPKKIVYVSCNPSTQARDLLLLQQKYEVVKSAAIDLFPHTYHIENVVLLHKK